MVGVVDATFEYIGDATKSIEEKEKLIFYGPKNWRRIVTLYDKLAVNYPPAVALLSAAMART